MANFTELLAQQVQQQAKLQARLSELLGIPSIGSTFEHDGNDYRLLHVFEQMGGHVLAIEAPADDPTETQVFEPVVMYLPQIGEMGQNIVKNPDVFAGALRQVVEEDLVPGLSGSEKQSFLEFLDLLGEGELPPSLAKQMVDQML